MKYVLRVVRRLAVDEEAPTMMEYGLLVILIAFVVLAGATAFGVAVGGLFETSASGFP